MATREISTTIKLDGEKAFNDQMKVVNNNLKNLRSEMAVVTSEFADNADSVEALTAKQKNLTEQVDQQKVKVTALSQAYEDQAAAFGENSAQADKYRQAMNQAQATLNKMERELDGVNEELDDHEKKLKEAERAQSKSAKAIEALKSSFKNAQKDIQLTSKALQGAGTAAGALATAGGAAVAALGALSAVGVAKLAQFAKEAAENGTEGFEALAENLEVFDKAVASAKASLGGLLLPTLEQFSADGGKLLSTFSEEITAAGDDPEKLNAAFSNLIRNGVAMMRDELPEMVELGMSLVGAISEGAIESTPEMFDMATEIIQTLLDGLDENADLLADAAVMLVTELVEFLSENAPELLVAAVVILSALVSGLAENAPQLVPAAINLILGLLTALIQNAPLLISAGVELIGGILIGLLNSLPDLLKFIPEMYQMIQDAVTESVSSMLNVGAMIIETILAGLQSAWESVKEWFSSAVGNLRGTAYVNVKPAGSHASGLSYVPYDGYLAELHQGEMVVPAKEAQILRSGGYTAPARTTTVNIYTQNLNESQIDYLYKRFNAELGASI